MVTKSNTWILPSLHDVRSRRHTLYISDSLTVAKDKGSFHKWPCGFCSTSPNTSENEGMEEMKGELEERLSDSSLKTLIASLIIFLEAQGRPDDSP